MNHIAATVVIATLVLLVFIAADVMGLFSSKKHFDVHGKTVVITGGSQGMGLALAKQLAAKGANIAIVARDQQKLDKALGHIKDAALHAEKQRWLAISADVTRPEDNERVLNQVTDWNHGQPPDIVWANAGAAVPGLFVDTPLDTLRAQMDINYWAAAYLAHATLKRFFRPDSKAVSNQPRHFIITSSSIAFVGLAGYGTYAPAKSALRSLADSLRSEVQLYNGARRRRDATETSPPRDVKIHIVLPGTILSPGLEQENKSKHPVTRILEEGDPRQTEDEVAAAAIKGLERGGFMITTQFLGHAMKASTLGGSPRDRWVVDTLTSWITSIVWLFVGPDLDAKVYSYGKNHGLAANGTS